MSVKTIGSLNAASYRATTPAAATPGFVTNDASGNFLFGQGGPCAPAPVGASAWDYKEHKEVLIATDSLIFSGLNGDCDAIYKLVIRNLVSPVSIPENHYVLKPNGLTTLQKTTRLRTPAGVVGLQTISNFSELTIISAEGNSTIDAELYFYAKSGSARRLI